MSFDTLYRGRASLCYEFLSVFEATPLLQDTFHTDHKQMFCWYHCVIFHVYSNFPFVQMLFHRTYKKRAIRLSGLFGVF